MADKTSGKKSSAGRLIIHGHFYQPPRENPWFHFIDRQRSASPSHDWNERILDECYRPNVRSRLLDGGGRIRGIVNNLEQISFNFGPTLLHYLKKKAPHTYRLILEADRRSADRRGGHGNAIAQGYNHVIMPLASRQERELQIRWGLADFELRFGRKAEGMWLPETAIHDETARQLVEEGVRFVILSPDQADSIRPLGEEGWTGTADAGIDTRRPYRLFPFDGDSERFLDIFFYHRELSVAVSFEHLLRDAPTFALRLAATAGEDDFEGRLVNVASDGEIYGHHEPFADMCLAALFDRGVLGESLVATNYGEHLDLFPPEYEVRIKRGDGGEGTAWSCSHGVGRWVRDCGCHIGHGGKWNQKWRTPLRRSLEHLRDELDIIWDAESARLFQDPAAARREFVGVLVEGTADSWRTFLERHLRRGLRPEGDEGTRAFDLMSLLVDRHQMFTSCGWFFDDISGIEPSQNLLYAGHAIHVARRFDYKRAQRAEQTFRAELAEGKSNLVSQQNGSKVFERRMREAALTEREWFAGWALFRLLGKELPPDLMGGRSVRIENETREDFGECRSYGGKATIVGPLGAWTRVYNFLAAGDKADRLRAWVTTDALPAELDLEIYSLLSLDRRVSLRAIRRSALPAEMRRHLVQHMVDNYDRRRFNPLDRSYQELERLERLARKSGVDLPVWLESNVARHRAIRFLELVSSLILTLLDGKDVLPLLKEAQTIHRWARKHRVDLVDRDIRAKLDAALDSLLDKNELERVKRMLTLAGQIGVEPLELNRIQNRVYLLIQNTARPDETLKRVALRLNFSPEIFEKKGGDGDLLPGGG